MKHVYAEIARLLLDPEARYRHMSESFTMPVAYRPARAEELERAEGLVVRSINELTERHDFGPMASLPFFLSTDGGATWTSFGTLDDDDKSIAWKTDGSAILVTPLVSNPIDTYSVTVSDSGFGSPINHYVGSSDNDQPWVRTGPSDHVYVAF